MVYARTNAQKKTAGNRINTARVKMKKIILMFVAVFGMAFVANAQADQCKLASGNGGYIDAYVSSTYYMNSKCANTTECPYIEITTTPSVDQPAAGKVLVKVTYIRTSDGEKEEITRSIAFDKSGSKTNKVSLDSLAKRIVSIEIWGAECKSASRPW